MAPPIPVNEETKPTLIPNTVLLKKVQFKLNFCLIFLEKEIKR